MALIVPSVEIVAMVLLLDVQVREVRVSAGIKLAMTCSVSPTYMSFVAGIITEVGLFPYTFTFLVATEQPGTETETVVFPAFKAVMVVL